jgi:hypothetical protein
MWLEPHTEFLQPIQLLQTMDEVPGFLGDRDTKSIFLLLPCFNGIPHTQTHIGLLLVLMLVLGQVIYCSLAARGDVLYCSLAARGDVLYCSLAAGGVVEHTADCVNCYCHYGPMLHSCCW